MKTRKAFFNYAVLALTCTLLASCKSSGSDEEEAPPIDQVTGTAPVIFGDPETNVVVGSQYLFLPEASDEDGDILTFSIGNKPAWAEFNTTTGQLQGTPQSSDVGEYPDILISVTDDTSVVSLPAFTITVSTAPQGGGGGDTGSAAPTVSGEPNQFVVAGTTYGFQPAATDPEGDALSWSIVNKPEWATFDPATGRLQGEPTSANLGPSAPIELSVTDGTSIAALPTFTITVQSTGSESYTLSWMAPTENEDGTALTDLAGYRIYYGMVAGEYTETVPLDNPSLTTFVLDNLAPGNYFLVMTAINSQSTESRYTAELALDPTT
ncbi:MAG TPA: putative Ig domain-containing protein [Woeseiaceae bacterium]|nr:putative Ig domain-containing protein [Woeseiaceae bacterium]